MEEPRDVGDGVAEDCAPSHDGAQEGGAVEPFESAVPELGERGEKVRRDHRHLHGAECPCRSRVLPGVPEPDGARSRYDGEGHQVRQPIVVDLAVRERDEHPLEVEGEDGPPRGTREAAGDGDGGGDHQAHLNGRDDRGSRRRERQEPADEKGAVEIGRNVTVHRHPRPQEEEVERYERVDEHAQRGQAGAWHRGEPELRPALPGAGDGRHERGSSS